ncbi:hypothetical protein F1737_10100 [Methanoplanus sp. FWC-SCC4]|uniref:DUF3658 domain-containing protein n=1 Tax=Methanochimaera problematica TaxID=2609417 RepID=A0AA97FDL6_9EURY|nr:DUF3658 domain-containing protein [Methanoplanus sp. FWC-SCC4]WOF17004.1 hypothetical protein F1737_10100 [Methanoplanus sp. FWC-SCC4]
MSPVVRHVSFSPSANGSLRFAFRDIPDYLFDSLNDDMSLGPINPYDVDKRMDFFLSILPEEESGKYIEVVKGETEKFWSESEKCCDKRILWFSRRSSSEYSGFLEYLSRADDLFDVEVVDLTEGIASEGLNDRYGRTISPYRYVPNSIAELRPEWLRGAVKLSRKLSERETEYYFSVWDKLKNENSSLRIISRGQLYSACDFVYDDFILKIVPPVWINAARVVGEALGLLSEEYANCGDTFIYSRLLFLLDSGIIEAKGDRKAMRSLNIRRII